MSKILRIAILLLFAFHLACTANSVIARQPNVVVFLTDDQGWGDLSLNGNTNLATPNIDLLAKDGASFDRFFVCPVCSPTRAEFLTGRYHPRAGVYSTSAGGERMDLDEVAIADTFKAAGYATAAFGKWHNGMQYPYHPNGRGFDYYYGFCSGHWGNYFDPMLERNGQLVKGNGFVIDDFTEEAMRFIDRNRNAPFFVYLPYNTPHSPMQVPERWFKKFENHDLALRHRDGKENMPHARAALAMCENIDWNVGRMLQKLEELQLADDTIVVFFHDNGPNGARWNGGMKGRKGSTDEGGVRSPLVIRWPGKIAGGTKTPQIGAAIDLLPTLASMCNVPLINQQPLDGVNLQPLLTGGEYAHEGRLIVNHWRNRVSVRSQRFRLDHQGKLFDMRADPGQRSDVQQQHPQQMARMKGVAEEFKTTVLANFGKDDRPFVMGHPDYKYTQIPARDATPHGGIKRSNRFPNCSFFSNWTNTEDKITWKAELLADGKFEVDVYYACAEEDVGSTIELRFGAATLRAQVAVANDAALAGAEHDRAARQESYVKDFKPMRMGTIELKKGTAELTLQAVKVANSQVMDFRLLMLTRVD